MRSRFVLTALFAFLASSVQAQTATSDLEERLILGAAKKVLHERKTFDELLMFACGRVSDEPFTDKPLSPGLMTRLRRLKPHLQGCPPPDWTPTSIWDAIWLGPVEWRNKDEAIVHYFPEWGSLGGNHEVVATRGRLGRWRFYLPIVE